MFILSTLNEDQKKNLIGTSKEKIKKTHCKKKRNFQKEFGK